MMMQSEPPYGIRTEELDHAKGSVPLLLAPLYLVFRPGRFMLGYGYHASVFVVLLAAWVIGAGGMTSSVINRAQFNALPEWAQVNSWGSVFALLFGLGLLRGALHYGLGGLWTWLLVYICGLRGKQWRLSTRLYCFPRLIEEVPALLGVVYMVLRFDDLRDALGSMSNAVPLVVMLFLFITPGVRFCMLLACGRVRVVWSIVLFLLLPYMWRIGLVAVMLWMSFVSPRLVMPDVDNPERFVSARFELEYPGNWSVSDPDPDDRRIEFAADHGTATLAVWSAPIEGPEVVEQSIEELRAQGYQPTLVDELRVTLGSQEGYGVEHTLVRDGKKTRMFHFVHELGTSYLGVFRYHSDERDWNSGKLAPMQVVDTIAFKGFENQLPDLANAIMIERNGFAFEVPPNWELSEFEHEQYTSFVVKPPQGGRFWCTIFDRPVASEKELDTYIEYSLWTESIESRESLSSMIGLQGVGVDLVCREPMLGKKRVRALYVPLADGRVLGIRFEQPELSAELTDPGFELIERSFELKGIEPASP